MSGFVGNRLSVIWLLYVCYGHRGPGFLGLLGASCSEQSTSAWYSNILRSPEFCINPIYYPHCINYTMYIFFFFCHGTWTPVKNAMWVLTINVFWVFLNPFILVCDFAIAEVFGNCIHTCVFICPALFIFPAMTCTSIEVKYSQEPVFHKTPIVTLHVLWFIPFLLQLLL